MSYLIKEWKEQYRGKGLWLGLSMIIIVSLLLILEVRSFPAEHGFTMYLLSLYEVNLLLLPLVCLFLSSFSLHQEKELKTLLILTTKKESYASFLWKKGASIQLITVAIFIGWFLLVGVYQRMMFHFDPAAYFYFLLSILGLVLVFNQIGLLLGSLCTQRLQLVGAVIAVWFLFVFITDLIFLHVLPWVTADNITLFSYFFFLDPLHANQFFLETSLHLFSLDHMSRLMSEMVWLPPAVFYALNVVFWVGISYVISILCKGRMMKVD